MTVELQSSGNSIKIIGKSNEEFFKNSRNKAFFTSNAGFGFEILNRGEKIIWEGEVEEEADLNEILDFIEKEKQKTKADPNIKKVANNRKQKANAHQAIKKIGTQIKTTKAKIHLKGVVKGFELLKFQKRPVKLCIDILSKDAGQGVANFLRLLLKPHVQRGLHIKF